MGITTLAWKFTTKEPLSLNNIAKQLGNKWYIHESDYRADSISGPITNVAMAQIFEASPTFFIVYLTVETENDSSLKTSVVEAKEKLFLEVLSLLNAQEIYETVPESAKDILTGFYIE